MKTLLARPLITLTVAASAVFLAGCLEQTRQAAPTVPVTTAAAPTASEPEIIARPNPAAANVSAPVAEVARLHLSGLDETVVRAFVEKSTNALSPGADELIYLKDIGVSPRIITAMIQQTAKMREQAAAAAALRASAPPAADPRPNMTVIAANATLPAAQPAAPAAPQPAAQPAVVAPAPAPQVAAAPAPVAQPAPANLPPQVNIFYQQLQPYGTWMQIADFGWCWQPSVVISTPSWRPYADRGRWLHTDHGWYWQSDYAWGWAPFHYGRWVQHARSGWLWVPDSTWGPAWVVWRSSTTHCGWAPLPPSAVFVAGSGLFHGGVRVSFNFDFGLPRHHYTFVPLNRFCDRNPYYYALAPTVVQNVYNQTTVINNIQVNNNVVVNGGVPADRVAVLTRSEIRKVAVREAATQETALSRLDRLEKSGNDLVIYRPVLNPNAPVKPMTLTNSKGETRTELVPAGALDGQKIKGRPVYDTTSTGVPVLTGYTTEPPASSGSRSTVVINNTITTTPPPAPVTSTTPTTPTSSASESKPNQAIKIFGITPGSAVAKRAEERSQPAQTVIIPNPAENSLFRPLTAPQPVTSTPQNLTPPQPVTSTTRNLTPSQPPSPYQPAPRAEVKKPQPTTSTAAPQNTSPQLSVQPATPAPVVRTPAPTYSAPVAPPRPTTVVPTYTPPPRPTVTYSAPPVQVQPAAPVAARPTVIVTPPPQPSSAPAQNNSSPSRSEPEKRK
ncbi:MAG: Uncharacterized protein FD161_4264 [Limisphaerales bacterium]|nr:MAG: Uncharacterized protein FD161_4264 [Limisphaerales bacterium]TXT47683.1 MAG: Uncharacterized protein FD140_4125 [Limisphaerales bacterium]